jgi:hypothetical protein
MCPVFINLSEINRKNPDIPERFVVLFIDTS